MNTDTTNNVETTQGSATEQETVKTYTQAEVDAMLQSEADRRVSQALAKQQQKFDKQLSLAKLDGNEREKAEKDNLIAELQEQLAEFKMEARKSEIKSVLAARDLSAEFADIIKISDDTETAQATIEKFDRLFKQAVNKEVEKRLGGSTPKNSAPSMENLTREDMSKMSYGEVLALKRQNPELYQKLTH